MKNGETKSIPQVCKNCRHWKHSPDAESKSEFGSCFRYPPIPIALEEAVACVVPTTEYKDFCGEFETRIDA